MNQWDWKLLLSFCIVCGVVSLLVLVVFATMAGILA
jgi:CHASE3 domain sensor protein